MRKTICSVGIGLAVLAVFTSSLAVPVEAQQVIAATSAQLKVAEEHLKQVIADIESNTSSGQLDNALDQIKEFDHYPLSPDAAKLRLKLAEALRKQSRFTEAVALLKKTTTDDPYNQVTPDSLSLLSNILYFDLKDHVTYGDYLRKLATDYYPEIPAVAAARAAYGANVPDAPRAKKILIDWSLGEASVFGRTCMGAYNGSQWDVIRTLGEAKYSVHSNEWSSRYRLTPDIMNQYGLIIITCGAPRGNLPMPSDTVNNIVNYVKGGGRLLVVSWGMMQGRDVQAPYLNTLLRKFGMEFQEQFVSNGLTSKCTPTDHQAVRGITEFYSVFGVPVKGGTPLGQLNSKPVVSVKQFGNGMVIAAGIGSGFCGNTMGDLYVVREREKAIARANKAFLLKLSGYLLSSVR